MSYILEALRKAERERNLGQAPLQAAPHSPPAPRRTRLSPRHLRLAAAVAVALGIGLTLWMRPGRAPTPEAATAAAPSTPAANPIAAPGGPVQLEDLLDPEAPKGALPLQEQRRLSEQAVAPQPPAPPVAVAEPAVIETPAEPEPTMAEQATGEPELPPEIKPLKQMSPDYRGNFPKVRIDVHAYDDEPARRFVIINGRKYHEGETLAEGPTIVTIESDGVVLNYNNEEVLVPIGR